MPRSPAVPLPLLLTVCLIASAPRAGAAQPMSRDRATIQLVPVHYDLTLRPDFGEGTLAGEARITVRNVGDTPAREVPLLLYRLLQVDTALAGGAPAPFRQSVVRFDDFPQLQVDAATVTLPRPLGPGDTATVEVRYAGYLLGYAETGMRYVRDHIDPAFTILRDDAFAFPLIGVASIAALRSAPPAAYDYLARVTVPESLTVVNAGRLVERTVRDHAATFVFRSVKPSWRMDFAIGPYGELREGPLRVAYLRPDSTGARRVMASARRALDLYTRWFGPVPGSPSLTIVEIEDGYGSQTDVAAIIQAAAAFRDPTRDRELYHEVAHLWNPPATDLPSPRWNEGLSSFLEYLVQEELSGRPVVVAQTDAVLDRLRQTVPTHPALARVPLADYGRAQLTDHAYTVGAVFFHLLYGVVGPERFRAVIGGYSQRYASGGSTRELAAFAAREAGSAATRLFDDWVFSTRWWDLVRDGASYDDLLRRYRAGG